MNKKNVVLVSAIKAGTTTYRTIKKLKVSRSEEEALAKIGYSKESLALIGGAVAMALIIGASGYRLNVKKKRLE